MMRRLLLSFGLLLILAGFAFAKDPGEIWDMAKLKQAPKAKWGPVREKTVTDANGKNLVITTRKVWYEGEPYKGKPTTVMAFYSRPKEKGTYPGLVLVHGGGGTAFSDWTEFWAARGYAAISMDHYGCEVDGEESSSDNRARHPLPNGIPAGSVPDPGKTNYKDTWPYHAIAAVMLAHSLLDAQDDVDPNRTGVTGLSWGGYLTALVAGIDDRFQTAVPVYGCGNLDAYSCFTPLFKRMSPESVRLWKEYFDPMTFLPRATCRMLFVTGTDDFAFPLEINRDSMKRAPNADVRLEVHMPHSMPTGRRQEFVTWFDCILKGGEPLPCLGTLVAESKDGRVVVSAPVKYDAKPVNARLWYSTDPGGYPIDKNGRWGKWQNRNWKSVPATISGSTVTAELPIRLTKRPVVLYLDATDARGNVASSHFERIEE